jgi:hypothetical protein
VYEGLANPPTTSGFLDNPAPVADVLDVLEAGRDTLARDRYRLFKPIIEGVRISPAWLTQEGGAELLRFPSNFKDPTKPLPGDIVRIMRADGSRPVVGVWFDNASLLEKPVRKPDSPSLLVFPYALPRVKVLQLNSFPPRLTRSLLEFPGRSIPSGLQFNGSGMLTTPLRPRNGKGVYRHCYYPSPDWEQGRANLRVSVFRRRLWAEGFSKANLNMLELRLRDAVACARKAASLARSDTPRSTQLLKVCFGVRADEAGKREYIANVFESYPGSIEFTRFMSKGIKEASDWAGYQTLDPDLLASVPVSRGIGNASFPAKYTVIIVDDFEARSSGGIVYTCSFLFHEYIHNRNNGVVLSSPHPSGVEKFEVTDVSVSRAAMLFGENSRLTWKDLSYDAYAFQAFFCLANAVP